MKIDAYNHILTPKYNQIRVKDNPHLAARINAMPAILDLDKRFKIMDQFGEYLQILTIANPPVEIVAGPDESPDLARIANDELAELVAKYPDRFAGAIAALPMNNVEATLVEVDRAIKELGLQGVQIFTHVNGRALDAPELDPIFQKMEQHDLPILLHPGRPPTFTDYFAEDRSHYDIWHMFGWPYDSTAAMTRLVMAGIFDRYPKLKIMTHHLGGLLPYLEGRIDDGFIKLGLAHPEAQAKMDQLKADHPSKYFPMFYADTATNGSVPALECGLKYFGEDRVLFATDMPFDSEGGSKFVRISVDAMTRLDASEVTKKKIYEDNARSFFKLKGRG